jgi:hypothetical protein
MWALGAIVRGRMCRALRFVVVVVVVLAAGLAVPVTASASAPVPHAVGPPFLILPSPNPPDATYSVLNDVSCTSTTNCFAVGSYESSSGTTVTLVERWDGTTWAIVPSPNPPDATYDSELFDVSCTSTTSCFAVGAYSEIGSGARLTLVERWDGTSWAIVPSPNPPDVPQSVLTDVSCTSTTSCFAVGWFGHIEGPRDTLIETLVERWDGASWAIVPSPNPGVQETELFGVSCTSTTNCFAVGDTGDEQGPFHTLVERWNGTTWAIVPSPSPTAIGESSPLYGVSCTSTTSCFAVGYFGSGTLVERWDGRSWAIVPSATSRGELFDVWCTSASNCVAVGGDNGSRTLVERWNGTWAIVRSANATGATLSELDGVSCTSTTSCFAVGYRQSDSGIFTLVERRR